MDCRGLDSTPVLIIDERWSYVQGWDGRLFPRPAADALRFSPIEQAASRTVQHSGQDARDWLKGLQWLVANCIRYRLSDAVAGLRRSSPAWHRQAPLLPAVDACLFPNLLALPMLLPVPDLSLRLSDVQAVTGDGRAAVGDAARLTLALLEDSCRLIVAWTPAPAADGCVPRALLDAVRTVELCLEHAETLDTSALERAVAGSGLPAPTDGPDTAYCLCRLVGQAAARFAAHSSDAVRNGAPAALAEAEAAGWQDAAAAAMRCLGLYALHAQGGGYHDVVLFVATELVHALAAVAPADARAAVVRGRVAAGAATDGVGDRATAALTWILRREEADARGRMPISSAAARAAQNLVRALSAQLAGPPAAGMSAVTARGGSPPGGPAGEEETSLLDRVGDDSSAAGVRSARGSAAAECIALVEAVRPGRASDVARWEPPGPARCGGWYAGDGRLLSRVGLHLVLPLVRFAASELLPHALDVFSRPPPDELLAALGDTAPGAAATANRQLLLRAGEGGARVAGLEALALVRQVLGQELLTLAQWRMQRYLAGHPSPALSGGEGAAHVGCAGLQDRPELHLSLLEALQPPRGLAAPLLRLAAALPDCRGGVGRRAAARGCLSILELLLRRPPPPRPAPPAPAMRSRCCEVGTEGRWRAMPLPATA